MANRTVEEIYQKKTQHEHILSRPDMYIGTIEPVTEDMWLYDEAENIMKLRKCTWTPGLYKIFDEILVNAADNKVRDPLGQTAIKVWIDAERGMVRVYNNGEGIPVQRHREHNLWVPEMIFGYLLTSSNYDDTEAKVTGGRNGFGAKLTNVFSTRFEVETVHSRSRKKFFMRWRNNMLESEEPVITPSEGPDYTVVTFYPDFAKFNLQGFGEDMVHMMRRRVYDVAGCTDKSLRCYLNDTKIACSSFLEYVDLYPMMGEERKAASYARVNGRWEVCVRVSNIGFQQVSFVNSIATTRGGTHVRYITDQVIAKVTEQAKRKSKTEVKPHMIRPHLFVFINCLVENPGFDSQTKETLNTPKNRFGSTCDLPPSMIDCILKSSIVERAVEMANSKLTREIASKLRNADRKQILGIPKLDDANEAGGKYSHRCTLILTEGDSAKALCTAGLAVKDRDYFGVFPLRGKPLNVRDATLKKVMACAEFQAVSKIMGLDIRQKYSGVERLRYGHLMIMSDQDHDGSHIKGLIINMIHHYWPDLIKTPGFLQQFITPIVKARKKGRSDGDDRAISFFSMPDYFEWKNAIGDGIRNYEIRYYKGLGTSGAKEGREYFENIDRHRLDFVHEDATDDARIVMAFAKDKVEERKHWITQFKANTNVNESMNYNVRTVRYSEFVDKELILFSVADCERSIPSVIDGLKPGQRKIIFSSFKRRLTRSIKVVQLAGYVSEHAAYHHGEQSLVQTIVGLAQNFVGSNNVPLLQQDGQFGTRLQGGKDHAAGRYIFTRLTNIARYIYHPSDDFVVDYKDDDGLSVEPFYYVPVIPMVLVNGTSGIGTGFATNIPNYSPLEVIDNLMRLLRGEEVQPMKPWYFGFAGTIEEKEKGKFVSTGCANVRPDGVVQITELPIGTWTQGYKKFLEELREKEVVVQYREHNTDVTVDFEVFLHPEVLHHWVAQGCVEERLQLREYIHATNIIAFDREGQITKYRDAEAVLKEFYLVRLEYYAKRRDFLIGDLRSVASKLENMVRFVTEVVDGRLIVTRRRKKELLEELRQRGYAPFPLQQKKKVSSTTIQQGEEEGAADATHATAEDVFLVLQPAVDEGGDEDNQETPEMRRAARDYDYLLGMRLWNLTAEMIARLQSQLQKARDELAALEKRTPKDLWAEDLNQLRPRIENLFEERAKEIASIQRKKMEKKRSFDPRRLRVPLLSEKARQALAKEFIKTEKKGGRAARVDGDAGGDRKNPSVGRKPAAKRRRKKNSDDDSDDIDADDDLFMSDASGGGGGRGWRPGDEEGDGGSDGVVLDDDGPGNNAGGGATKPQPKRPTAKRAPRKPKEEGLKRVKKEAAKKVVVTDDFDIDEFGIEALTRTAPKCNNKNTTTTAKTTTAAFTPPPQSTRVASVIDTDTDDDLALLGISSVDKKTLAPVPPPKRSPQRPKSQPKKSQGSRKRRRSSSSDEDSFFDDDDDDDEDDDDEASSGSSSYDFSD
ncbi:DNA topoisomerase II, putative [Trypanosoma cruzi]|uniref:DNA topoisomerase 2 n=1 Tax=Trypanosoma cruzi (strain CL Brener) TaxID=353153 RepID=Q4DE53_TRYCC|nr:DNA topoisomerase II, putative [Trypanosoma cruzi]EAN90793.1 DNA topoisomerase II, putative [Trypanosoma cruzi]|eukprot:XP_812644.1 DNA topoisomerase II [Trypanosoma cruzi strain CL Brener]